MSQSIDLAALLCSRLCHDMLSPVGALSNGIELLRDEGDPEMRQRCLELLEQSARISTDKLRFFRLAYGAAGGFGDNVAVEEPRGLIAALVANNGRIELAWAVTQETLPKPAVKILLNLAAIGGSLPPSELSGRTAPAYMIRQIAEAAGGGVQYALSDGALVMGAVLPDA